jgi:hypothetical protein
LHGTDDFLGLLLIDDPLPKHFLHFGSQIALFVEDSNDVVEVRHSSSETEGFLIDFDAVNEG